MSLFDDHTYVHETDESVYAAALEDLLEGPTRTLGADFRPLMTLHADHASRPCWVCPNGLVYVEMHANPKLAQQACEFLIGISEPESRPRTFHHYRITSYSLYAGSSMSLDTSAILVKLGRFSKNVIPANVVQYIRACTESYGKAKLVLKNKRLFVESVDDAVVRKIANEQAVWNAQVKTGTGEGEFIKGERQVDALPKDDNASDDDDDDDDGDDVDRPHTVQTTSFEIDPDKVEQVKSAALNMTPPCALMDEYDFKRDKDNPNLKIRLTGQVREYQAKALMKMFANGRARSGVIVLPCGAGKTLTGISACCKVGKSTVVMCPNANSVDQWKDQFHRWAEIKPENVCKFTKDDKDPWPGLEAIVLITTYTSIGHTRRSAENAKVMERMRAREWGLVIADEVHQVPADSFRRAIGSLKVHCKLGLTATLVREDGKISELNYLIGPKIYEADWQKLTEQGYLARVKCVEVWCPMTPRFMREYLVEPAHDRRRFLYAMNPNKVLTCEQLVRSHEKRGDKILVFSDSLAPLKKYAAKLNRPWMSGETKPDERKKMFHLFRLPHGNPAAIQTLCLSSIGDQAIDLPDANVLIQISSHFGSRRQEAQRLGRILRPKASTRLQQGGVNAYFYTLVSEDTAEMFFSNNRRQYLVDQGYNFSVLFMERVVQPITRSSPEENEFIRQASAKVIDNENHESGTELFEVDPEAGDARKRLRA